MTEHQMKEFLKEINRMPTIDQIVFIAGGISLILFIIVIIVV